MFNSFPKKRIDLPPEYQKIYNEHYINNRTGGTKVSSMTKRLEAWLHKKVADDIRRSPRKFATLEIGAGTLNHIEYELNSSPYDIVEPFKELFRDSSLLKKVRTIYSDIDDIDMAVKYDRIVSIATFEHILDLPDVIARSAILLDDGGSMRVSIPNEGTIMWRLGTMITGFEFKRNYGLDYRIIMKYEHVNTADEIEDTLRYFFKKIKTSVLGINKKIAFYRFYACSDPNSEAARDYLKSQLK